MRLDNEDAIHLDWCSGKVTGATLSERMGLAMMRLAAVATQSPERPGFSKLVNTIKSLFPSDRFVQIHFPGSVYQFPYGDAYWSVLCAPGFTYEKEIEGFVRRCAQEKLSYVFVDCGANFGYWSSRVSSQDAGAQRAIAIEASIESFDHTLRNRALNDNRFIAHHRAVSDRDGDELTIDSGSKHEQRAVTVAASSAAGSETVISLSLAKLADVDPKADNIVLKLDIEGLEIPALKSANHWLEHNTLVIFEDHGSDTQHLTAKAFMDEFGLQVFAGSADGRFTRIVSLDQMTAIKSVRRKGYDFFATKSSFWLEFLARYPVNG